MGSLNKKLFDKLIKKIGFEALFYDTLVSFCNEVEKGLEGVGNQGKAIPGGVEIIACALEEAKELLEAYEEYLKDNQGAQEGMERMGFTKAVAPPKFQIHLEGDKVPHLCSSPSTTSAGQVEQEATPSFVEKSQDKEPAITLPKRNSEQEEVCRVVVKLPLQEPDPAPKPTRTTVQVDDALGEARGTLFIPQGYRIVNRGNISIRTKHNLILGGAGSDGQVKGSSHVSGIIQSNGKYALVFKDTTLGSAIIRYEILQERKPKVLELEMISLPDGDEGEWISFVQSPEITGVAAKANSMEDAKKELISRLKRNYDMKIISVTTIKATKQQEEAMKQRKALESST